MANVGCGFFAPYGLEQKLLALIEYSKQAAIDPALRAALAQHQELVAGLDRLCALRINQALRYAVPSGDPQTVDEIADWLRVIPAQRGHLEQSLRLLADEGLIERERGGDLYAAPQTASDDDGLALAARLQAEHPQAASAIALLLRCVELLPAALRGESQRLDELAATLRQECEDTRSQYPAQALANAMLVAATQAAAAQAAGSGNKLRILELGAGSGVLTALLWPRLEGHIDNYLACDGDADLLAMLHQRITHPQLVTRVLDCTDGKALEELAAAGGNYDLVIAGAGLHAVADLRRTLQHIRRLLRPESHLLLIEATRPTRIAECTLGLLEDWWSTNDGALRRGYALLNGQEWQGVLAEAGFGVALVPVARRGQDLGLSLLIAATPADMSASLSALLADSTGGHDGHGGHATRYDAMVALVERTLAAANVAVAERNQSFSELGVDSLTALKIGNALQQNLGRTLSPSLLFEHDTLHRLAVFLSEDPDNTGQAETKIEAIVAADHYELSFAQQRLWFLEQLAPDSAFYNIPSAVRLRGPLNRAALGQAFNEIVRRHETLRTTFVTIDGKPQQIIAGQLELALAERDLSALEADKREEEVRRLASLDAQKPFDLTRGPLIRTELLRLSDQEHVLLLNMHHIISDGWSMSVLVQEVAALYSASATGEGRAPSLAELPIQYKDYAYWQRLWLSGSVLEKQLGYWQTQLKGAPPVLTLTTDHPRPAIQSYRGANYAFALDQRLADSLQELSRREGVTLFMTLLAAFQTLLSRYTGQTDLCVGSPIANRNRAEIEGLIGFFV
ncbi:MAG: condensation domain-containing protein, partial [Nevskiales bacterium]